VNRRTMAVNSLPKTVTRQRRDCDLNPGPSAPESSTLTTRLPSHPCNDGCDLNMSTNLEIRRQQFQTSRSWYKPVDFRHEFGGISRQMRPCVSALKLLPTRLQFPALSCVLYTSEYVSAWIPYLSSSSSCWNIGRRAFSIAVCRWQISLHPST